MEVNNFVNLKFSFYKNYFTKNKEKKISLFKYLLTIKKLLIILHNIFLYIPNFFCNIFLLKDITVLK